MNVDIWLNYKNILNSFSPATINESDNTKKENSEQNIIKLNSSCMYCHTNTVLLDNDEGGYICESCGRKIEEYLDQSQEWRNHYNDDSRKFGDPSRVGLPINEHFKKASLSTIILGYGNELYRRYHIYNSMDYDERRLLKNFQLIENNVEDNNIPESVREHAKNMFKKISDGNQKRGARKHSNMAACIFFASQDKDIRQNKEKLSDCFKIKKKKFTKGCNFYKEAIFEKEPEYYQKLKPTNTDDEINRFAELLNIPDVYKNIIKYVSHMATELGIILKNTPASVAVGSLYLVAQVYKLNISKKEIVEQCDVSDVTINKAYSAMFNHKTLLIPTKKLYDEYINLQVCNKTNCTT